MTKLAERQIKSAREALRSGNGGTYARIIAAAHRASLSDKHRKAIEAAIGEDDAGHLFAISNGSLVAR